MKRTRISMAALGRNQRGEGFQPSCGSNPSLSPSSFDPSRAMQTREPLAAPSGRRSAWTLLELVVVITLSGLLMGIAIRSLMTVYRTDRVLRGTSVYLDGVHRWIESFRRDAHQANRATTGEQGRAVTFELPGGRSVAYRHDGKQWVRDEWNAGTPKPITKFFHFGRDIQIHFIQTKSAASTCVSARIEPAPINHRPSATAVRPMGLSIDAMVGRDRPWIPDPRTS